jgi:hypothetical protein
MNQNKRFFSFGCSFTNYDWVTWPDLISDHFDFYQNWGHPGGGNLFISNSIMEADQRHTFTSDDTIIVCWTNVAREDKYTNQGWHLPGNIYTQRVYSEEWVKFWITERGCLIRDIAIIKLVKSFLELKQCKWIFLSMVPLDTHTQYSKHIENNKDIINLYSDVVASIRPSFVEVLYNNDFSNKTTKLPNNDPHPTPLEHLEYLEKVVTEFPISDKMRDIAKIETEKLMNGNTNLLEISKLPFRQRL